MNEKRVKKEKKKKSIKSKYCNFEGTVVRVKRLSDVPRKVACPECNRRLEPTIVGCKCCDGERLGYGFKYGMKMWCCYIDLKIKKHKRKNK